MLNYQRVSTETGKVISIGTFFIQDIQGVQSPSFEPSAAGLRGLSLNTICDM